MTSFVYVCRLHFDVIRVRMPLTLIRQMLMYAACNMIDVVRLLPDVVIRVHMYTPPAEQMTAIM